MKGIHRRIKRLDTIDGMDNKESRMGNIFDPASSDVDNNILVFQCPYLFECVVELIQAAWDRPIRIE